HASTCNSFDGYELEKSYDLGFKYPTNCIDVEVTRKKHTNERTMRISLWSSHGGGYPKMHFPVTEGWRSEIDLAPNKLYEIASTVNMKSLDEDETVEFPTGTVSFTSIADENNVITTGILDIKSFDPIGAKTRYATINF